MDADTERKLLEQLDRAEILDCLTRYAARHGPTRPRAGPFGVPRGRDR